MLELCRRSLTTAKPAPLDTQVVSLRENACACAAHRSFAEVWSCASEMINFEGFDICLSSFRSVLCSNGEGDH